MQIRKFKNKDREKIIKILNETNMFTEEEINVAIEVIDDFLARLGMSSFLSRSGGRCIVATFNR